MYQPNKPQADQPSMRGFNPNPTRTNQPDSVFTGVGNLPSQPMRPQMPQNPTMMNQKPMNASSTPMMGQMGAIQRNLR